MDFSTEYLGMKLPHPLVAGAGPLADDLDGVAARGYEADLAHGGGEAGDKLEGLIAGE